MKRVLQRGGETRQRVKRERGEREEARNSKDVQKQDSSRKVQQVKHGRSVAASACSDLSELGL